jgi:hypothetical protein
MPARSFGNKKSDPASGVARLDRIDAYFNVRSMRLVPDAAIRRMLLRFSAPHIPSVPTR